MNVSFLPKEGRRDRWVIMVDGERWREVHRTIFGAKPRFPDILSESDIQTLFDAYEYRRVKNYLLWLLSRQSYHSEQLGKMLRDRLVQEQTIHLGLTDLQTQGILDDASWLRAFMQSQEKRYGLPVILSKLRQKGLSHQTLGQMELVRSSEEERNTILHLLETRYRSKDLKDRKTRQKVFAALMRKGFSYEKVRQVLH